MIEDPLTQQVYNEIKGTIRNKTVDKESIIMMVTLLIPIVQRLCRGREGTYKKQVVITVLTRLVDDSSIENHAKNTLYEIIQVVVPEVIDSLISVATHKLDIGKGGTSGGCCVIT